MHKKMRPCIVILETDAYKIFGAAYSAGFLVLGLRFSLLAVVLLF